MTVFFIIMFISQSDRSYCYIYVLMHQFLKGICAFSIDTAVSPTWFCWVCCLLLLQIYWIWFPDIFFLGVSVFLFANMNVQINKCICVSWFSSGMCSLVQHRPCCSLLAYCGLLHTLSFRRWVLAVSLEASRLIESFTKLLLLNWDTVFSNNFSAWFCCCTYCLNIWAGIYF